MLAWGLGAVALAAAVLCGLLGEGELLRIGGASEDLLWVRGEETRHRSLVEAHVETEETPAEQDTRLEQGKSDGLEDWSERQPVSEEDGAANAGVDNPPSRVTYRSQRPKRAPLRISRIGKYRPDDTEIAPKSETDGNPAEHIDSAENIRLSRHQSDEEEAAPASFKGPGPIWNSRFPEGVGSHRQNIKTEIPRLGEIEHQLESSRVASGAGDTEAATLSDPETEHGSRVGPEPNEKNADRSANVTSGVSNGSELAEQLQKFSSRIQSVRQKLTQRLSNGMR